MSTSRFGSMSKGEKFADESGDCAQEEISKQGHVVANRKLVSDEPKMIRREVASFLSGSDDVVVLMGGTGVSSRDVTIETVRPYFEKELDGFGELLRSLSFKEIGTAAVMTRATAGVAKGKLILCLPGSPSAVSLALRSFGKELPHAIYIARS